jgi:hypothetical protein
MKRFWLYLCIGLLAACGTPEKSARPIEPVKPIDTAPTPSPTLQPPEVRSACDHPFLPLQLGAQWSYHVSAKPTPLGSRSSWTAQWMVYDVAGNTRHATMSLSPTQDDQFECTLDTGIAALGYDYTSPGFEKMFHLLLPPADRLQVGYAWSGSNHLGMKLGGGMIALREDLTETYTVLNNEPVVFDGRTYDGRRILRTAAARVTGCGFIPNCTNADGTLRQNTEYRTVTSTTLTLARGVGIIEIVEAEEYFSANDHYQVQLTYALIDYDRPDTSVPIPPQTSATRLPTSTPIVIEPTVTSPATETPVPITPIISAARGAQITALNVSPERANPGDSVTLSWAAQGDRAMLCPDSRYTLFTAADCVNVPVSGAQSFVIPADVKGNKSIEFVLTVSGAAGSSAKQGTSVAMNCRETWFFSAEPQAGVCPQDVIRTQAAFQSFERGAMIRLKEPGRYFILENQNVAPGDIRRPLNRVADPLDITRNTEGSVPPPAGFSAPTSGFGLIWRGDVTQSTGFRDQLGWALQPEFGYEATYQCDDATPSGGRVWQTCYLTTLDDQIIALLSTGAWFWREEQLHQSAPKTLSFAATRTEARLLRRSSQR